MVNLRSSDKSDEKTTNIDSEQLPVTDIDQTSREEDTDLKTTDHQNDNGSVKPVYSPENDHRFGWGKFKPSWLQCLNTTRWLLVFLGIGNVSVRLSQGALLPGNITTLQQRFGIDLAAIGLIFSMNDIVSIIMMPFVCYFGEKYHKGHFVGVGFMVAAVGSFMFTLPQWLSQNWADVVNEREGFQSTNSSGGGINFTHLCTRESGTGPGTGLESCPQGPGSNAWASTPFLLFLLAQGVIALGAGPVETVGFTYLDENVTQKSSGLYLTLFHVSGMLSGVIGFTLSAALLSIFGDFYRTSAERINQLRGNEDSWYGAWWMGFLLAALLGFIAVLPIMGYPRELPTKGARRAKDKNLSHVTDSSEKVQEVNFGQTWASYLPTLKALAVNPAYVLNNIRGVVMIFVMSGFITFMPLYIKYAFDLSNQKSTIFGALVMIIPALLGAVAGGVIMRCRAFTVRELMVLVTVLLAAAGLFFLTLFNYCRTPQMAGVNVDYQSHYRDWKTGLELNNTCNSGCHCSRAHMQTMCDTATGLEYFSPCHAGCDKVLPGNNKFENCRCPELYFPQKSANNESGDRYQKGTCKREPGCGNKRIIVLIALAISSFLTGMEMAPNDQITLRSVPFSARIVAKGVQMIAFKLLGFIPGPIVFGLILDSCCIVKAYRCGQEANCIQYSIERMTALLVGMSIMVRVISMALLIIASLLFKPVDKESWSKVVVGMIKQKRGGMSAVGKVKPSESSTTFGLDDMKLELDDMKLELDENEIKT